jgi:undecaprenyl-diphosphatase
MKVRKKECNCKLLGIIQTMDEAAMLFIQNYLRAPVLNYIMGFFSVIGDMGACWLVLGLCLMITKKYRRQGFNVILAVAVGYCFNDLVIKNLVQRPRPFLTIPELTTIVSKPDSWSFPSGHACAAFGASYSLTRDFKRRGALSYIAAVLIAVSRPYVGVHYVSDIIVGASVGTVFSVLTYCVSHKIYPGRAVKTHE